MSKLLSKITVTSIAMPLASFAIASVLGGAYYLSSTPGTNNTISVSNNSATTLDTAQATLVSTWDKETEPNYSGTRDITVYRSPSCGCCGVWLEHAKQHGFKVKDVKTEEMEALKQKHNVPPQLASCHTTIVDGYVMEGHIPVDDIKRFLTEKPDNFAGLAVPGMPLGSPGMEAGDMKQPFKVLAFNDKGQVEVFQEYQSY